MGDFFTSLTLHVTTQDLALLGFLVFLEGILSIDNALVLAMMANHLPPPQQKKALTYGLLGSVVFRLAALAFARKLMEWHWVKLAGGAYLLYVAISHLWNQYKLREEKQEAKRHPHGFWKTVALIEVMDIAFAVDSILAAVALTPKFWLVFSGGMLGVILIRFAASAFLKLLAKFPGFESTAYLLVLVIGIKLCVDWLALPGINFHSSASVGFWAFWGAMLACIAWGFRPHKKAI